MTILTFIVCLSSVLTGYVQAFPRFSDLDDKLWSVVNGSVGIDTDRERTVESLLRKGANPNLRDPTYDSLKHLEEVVHNAPYNPRDTILMRAARNQEPLIVRALLRHGAKPNAQGLYGATALDRAD